MSGGAPISVVLAPGQLPREGEVRTVAATPSLRLLVARAGGRLYALDDMCNHGGCPLSKGRLDGTRVTCPCHGMAFDLRDGRLLSAPRLAGDQPSFRVIEEGGGAVVLVDARD